MEEGGRELSTAEWLVLPNTYLDMTLDEEAEGLVPHRPLVSVFGFECYSKNCWQLQTHIRIHLTH